MNISLIISIIALAIAIFGTISSFYFQFRDKVQLVTNLIKIEYHPDYDRARLRIKIVNKGRRPALLTLFGGNLSDGGNVGTVLGSEQGYIRLSESEFDERYFYKEDIEHISPEGNFSEFIELWYQDSLGNRHIVKNSKEGIIWLKNQYDPMND